MAKKEESNIELIKTSITEQIRDTLRLIKKKRYIVYFLIRDKRGYAFVSKKRINPSQNTVRFRKKATYQLDIENYYLTRGNKQFYAFDIKRGQIIIEDSKDDKSPVDKKKQMPPTLLDDMITENTFAQIVNGLEGKKKFDYMTFISGLGIGVIGGFILSMFI